MPTLQEQLSSLRIVQLQGTVLFFLEFDTGAKIAYDCLPENFTLDLSINPNSVRNILRTNQNNEA